MIFDFEYRAEQTSLRCCGCRPHDCSCEK